MKAWTMGAALAAVAALAGPASADQTAARYAGHAAAALAAPPRGGVVVVSCFRGPLEEVIWDRPEGVFLESLRAVGYDYATAESIANRVCRDVTLVGDDAALKAEMERIVAESPNFRRY